jgi:glycosyltransferase involved in cell wall biosynthesis
MAELNNPLVSIIINCFNGERYLKQALISVLNQSYKNWELIFWDNRSTDNSKNILNSFKDRRIKYFFAEKHTPLYQARNLAIQKSTGELIAFIDTDDLWDLNKLELQVPFFKNEKISLVYSNLWITKKNIEKKKIFIKKKSPSGYIYETLLDDYNVGIITTIFRKNIVKKENKIFDERFSIIGDFDFFLKLSKSHYFHYINKPLAYYRIHDSNFSSIFKDKEIKEFDTWLSENKKNIEIKKLNKISQKINLRKLLHYKFNSDYKNCFIIFKKNFNNFIAIKILTIIFTPLFILKKISWFHN